MVGTISRSKVLGKGVYGINDLRFPVADLTSDYKTSYSSTMTDRQLINVTNCQECSLIFAAKLG